jgi:sulfatase modifying factor 1
MNRKRWIPFAALTTGLVGAIACNGLVGNDSVSLWSGDSGDQSDASLVETGADASVGVEDGNGTLDAPTADGSGDSPPGTDAGAEAASDAASDSDAEGGPCTDACIVGATECAPGGAAVQRCEAQTNGCAQWVTTATCGSYQTCTGAGSGAACTCTSSICVQAGSVCSNGQTLATCAVDGDGCPYTASTSTCPSPESCSGTAPSAACSLTCSSSCTQGQTACISGGLATCAQGSNGCWAYGTPVACGGVRQTCTGPSGSAACTCNASSLCSSAAAACANPSLIAVCAQDAYGCFYEGSSSPCSGSTPVCLNGACVQCGSGQMWCSSSAQPQTCDSSGTWQNATACSGSTPLCSSGVCGCVPGALQCSGGDVQTCGTNNEWGTAVACAGSSACAGPGLCETTTGPSCQASGAGLSNCGSSGENCCTSVEVPGGTFDRTYANAGTGPTGEADAASVSGFRLDKYDVTVGRFRQFVSQWNAGWTPSEASGMHTHLNGGQGLANSGAPGTYETGWVTTDDSKINPTNSNLACSSSPSSNTWTNTAGSQENLPINCVNWYEAYAFCIWDGGFLPSEAEWRYAAAGGTQQREYPWGEATPGTACPGTGCQYAIYGCYYPSGTGNCTGVTNIAPVGSATLGAGLWGQLDLAGNLFQFALDWSAGFVDPCTDCADLTAATNRVLTGGRFNYLAENLLVYERFYSAPLTRFPTNGFRCARTP